MAGADAGGLAWDERPFSRVPLAMLFAYFLDDSFGLSSISRLLMLHHVLQKEDGVQGVDPAIADTDSQHAGSGSTASGVRR